MLAHALHRPDLVTSIKTTCIKTTSIETVERAHDEGKLKFQHHWRSLVYNFPVIRKQNCEFKKFIIQKQSIQKNKAIKEYLWYGCLSWDVKSITLRVTKQRRWYCFAVKVTTPFKTSDDEADFTQFHSISLRQ